MNEIKFTLSASSSSSQNYSSLEDEPGVEIPTETPDYIKKITSKRKLNALISLQFWANSRLRTGNIDENNVEMLEDFTQCFFFSFSKISAAFVERYDLGKVLGAGGFGQVMAATRKKDNLPVSRFSCCILLSCYHQKL